MLRSSSLRPGVLYAAAAALACAAVVILALLFWPRPQEDAVVMGRLELPAGVADLTLIHGEALAAVAEITCAAEDGWEQPIGAEIAEGAQVGVVVEDPPPTLFDIHDFTYETFQSAYYTRDSEALLEGSQRCDQVLDDLLWALVLTYPDEAQAASSLTTPLDAYDYLVEPAEARENWDYLGCWQRPSGTAECWAPAGELVVITGSRAEPGELADRSRDLLAGIRAVG